MLVFSMPYALLVTSVLFGKHIDKIVPDSALGIRTVPVILGERLARRTNQALMILFYPLVLLAVLAGWVGPWVLLSLLAIPTLWGVLKVYNQPKPDEPPAWYPTARLAAVVRRLRLPPRPPGRRAADGGPAAQRRSFRSSCRCPGFRNPSPLIAASKNMDASVCRTRYAVNGVHRHASRRRLVWLELIARS